jgi:dihydroneopterin aldolase / 2-amino-4-hydroxy-6-hydroxymethyldihydropteridine diphosphokinase / dihydropteroate synthase
VLNNRLRKSFLFVPPTRKDQKLIMAPEHLTSPDEVFLESLTFRCICGSDGFGRPKPQPVVLSVRLSTSIARAAVSDRVDLSIDYSALAKKLDSLGIGTYKHPVDLLERVSEIAFGIKGVGGVSVKVECPKAILRGKLLRWEYKAWLDDGIKSEWKCSVEGIEVPIIIGIEENIHERTQKQVIIVDLDWQGYDGDAQILASFPTRELVFKIIQVVILPTTLTVVYG